MITLLQWLVSLIFFANKVFVLVGKKMGWALGVLGALLATCYFVLLRRPVFTVFEIGLCVLMFYGLLKGADKSVKVELSIRIVTTALMLAVTTFAFRGDLVLLEFLASVSLMWGTYLLTTRYKRMAWALHILAHGCAALFADGIGQLFFRDMQIASAIVAVAGTFTHNNGAESSQNLFGKD